MSSSTAQAEPEAHSLKPPLGISDFGRICRDGYTFIDKTLLIRDILADGAQVTLITRPRRFGKTLNLSMLHHFFASRVAGHATRRMFRGLAISEDREAMRHQGRYSVVFVTLKDIKEATFEATLEKMAHVMSSLFGQHRDLAGSARLAPERLTDFKQILARTARPTTLANSLKLLCDCLHSHHGKPVILLIDEYDSPMHAGYTHGYFDEIAGFMRGLLGSALKDNPALHKAVLTGILRVSKESLFSGLNNIEVNTVLSTDYARWFGFTEKDVAELLMLLPLEAPDREALAERIRGWYNGYRFGNQTVHNPWSILSCLKHDGLMQPYWVNTSDNALLKAVMARALADIKKRLEDLVRGEILELTFDPNLAFRGLDGGGDALWSLLVFTGYLTAADPRYERTGYVRCRLSIPNEEVLGLYERNFTEWFTDRMSAEGYRAFLDCLLAGKLEEFRLLLEGYLLESMSLFDASGLHPENFYHGLVLGLMFGLRETHVVYSNRESGFGRYDVALLPKQAGGMGIVMEFKRVDDPARIDAAADQALRQVDERWYHTELLQHGVARVLKIGMALSGKQVRMRSAMAA